MGRRARSVFDRLTGLVAAVAIAATALTTFATDPTLARGEERALKLLNVHTNERAVIVYKRGKAS